MRDNFAKNNEEFSNSSVELIPTGWQVYSIGELMNFIKSGLSRAITFDDIGVPVITSTNLVDSELNTIALKYWYEKDPQGSNIADYILDDGDILLNFINSVAQIGKVCIFKDLGRPAIYTTNIFRIKPNNKVTTQFLWRLLQSNDVQHWIQLITKPAINQASFTQPEFAAIPVVIPESKEEQDRITEILDTIDSTITQTGTLIAKLKQIKIGLLHDLLTRGLDENGELRDATQHPEQFKDSPLGRIPKDWEVVTVGEYLAKIEQGWSPDCELNSTPIGEWGVLKTTAVVWEGYQDFENKKLPSHLPPDPNYEVKPGDVLMTRAGPNSRVGVVALVRQTQGKLILSDKLYRLIPRDCIKPDFLTYALSGNQTQRHLSTLKTGLAESQTNISQEIVRTLLIPIPTIQEQEKISSILDTQDIRIRKEEAYLNKLKLQKQGLMHDLLTGKVRVKNA